MMTIKEAIMFICKREFNALRADCNKPVKYHDVEGVRAIMEAYSALKAGGVERVANGLFKRGDRVIAKRFITYSTRRECLCYYPVKMRVEFMEE